MFVAIYTNQPKERKKKKNPEGNRHRMYDIEKKKSKKLQNK